MKIVMDLDGTICTTINGDYKNSIPIQPVIDKLKELKDKGCIITIHTARNMRTFGGDIGKINVHTLPIIIDWLQRHDVPFDEIIVGKPWCMKDGYYVDDKAIRPSEFITGDPEMILENEKHLIRNLNVKK